MDEFDLETLWASLLSRDPEKILPAWERISREEQGAVRAHLERMATEEGWSEPQRQSARVALDTLSEDENGH